MQSDRVRQRYRNSHPVMAVLLIVRCLVPVRHQKQSLDERDAINFVVKVV